MKVLMIMVLLIVLYRGYSLGKETEMLAQEIKIKKGKREKEKEKGGGGE